MDVFAALADPVRREIVRVLAAAPHTAGEVAARFPISRPATSRHLRLLVRSGVVDVQAEGRTRVFRLTTDGLHEVWAFLAEVDGGPLPRLASALDALETEVHRARRQRERRGDRHDDEEESA